MTRLVDHQPGGDFRTRTRPSQKSLHACHQLAHAEGLAQVIVGARLEADEAVHFLDPRRHHDDRQVAEAAHFLADLHAIAAGQHQVEHDQVGMIGLHPRHGVEAVRDALRFEARRLEVVGHQLGELRLVFDDQDLAHGSEIVTRNPPSDEAPASMLPPCASTTLRTMARPRPAPPLARLREPSTR